MKADYSGQTDIFNPRTFTWPVQVIGVGGIGSAVVLPLVKLGLSSVLHLWDPDLVEPHNIPAQLVYRTSDIGRPKVEVAAEFLQPFLEPGCGLVTHQDVVDADTTLEGVVIGAVDSMKSRYAIWEGVKYNTDVPLYLDGRIGGEQMQLLTLNPCDVDAIDYYEYNWMFSDEEGADLPCAARTVIHPSILLAGHMVAQLTRFARDLPTKRYIDVHAGATQMFVA